jgi:hypothetical protein
MQTVADLAQPLSNIRWIRQTGKITGIDLIDAALNRLRRFFIRLTEENALAQVIQHDFNKPAVARRGFDFSQT